MTEKSQYIPALDGLRAMSIGLVIYSHLSFGSLPKWMRATTLGNAGVIIFFVISGYLITSQLAAEKMQTGQFRLRPFLVRRFLRLAPALTAMLLIAALLNHIGWVTISNADFAHALTYTMDYYQPPFPVLEHLWSLSVEEQFYLLWPLCFLPFYRVSPKATAAVVVLLAPLIRFAEWHVGVGGSFRHFECVADCLAAGCLLALIKPPTMPQALAALAFGAIVICSYFNKIVPGAPIITVTIETASAFVIVTAVLSAKQNTLMIRALTVPSIRWLGRLSYSLYLWQQIFLLPYLPEQRHIKHFLSTPPLNIFFALAAAALSYYFIEAPFRKFGRRFKTPSLKNQYVDAAPVSAN